MNIILGFANLSESDNVKQFFDNFGPSNYQLFEEISSKGKVHVHFILLTHLKKNSFDKDYLLKNYPQLKRPKVTKWDEKQQKNIVVNGGEHNYSTKAYPQQYKVQAYDEKGQDYVAKDGKPIGGTLWTSRTEFHSTSSNNPLPPDTGRMEWELRKDRYWKSAILQKKHPKEARTSLEQKFQNYMNEILKKDPWYFLKDNSKTIGPDLPKLNQRLLIKEIKNFYKDNGRPANRAIHKVIAEAVIWYGEIVMPKDKETIEDNNNAIYNEIDKLLTGR